MFILILVIGCRLPQLVRHAYGGLVIPAEAGIHK